MVQRKNTLKYRQYSLTFDPVDESRQISNSHHKSIIIRCTFVQIFSFATPLLHGYLNFSINPTLYNFMKFSYITDATYTFQSIVNSKWKLLKLWNLIIQGNFLCRLQNKYQIWHISFSFNWYWSLKMTQINNLRYIYKIICHLKIFHYLQLKYNKSRNNLSHSSCPSNSHRRTKKYQGTQELKFIFM